MGPHGTIFVKISQDFGKFCSFLAASAPIFASKYAFFIIFQIYKIVKLKFSNWGQVSMMFADLCRIENFVLEFYRDY